MAPTRVIGVDPHADTIVWAMYTEPGHDLGYTAGALRYDKDGLVTADDAPAQLAIGKIVRRAKKVNYVPTYHSILDDFTHRVIPGEPNTFVLIEDIFCRSRAGFKTLARVQGEFLYELEREVPRGADSALSYDFTLDVVLATTWQSKVFNTYLAKDLQKGANSKAKSSYCAQRILHELLPDLKAEEVLTTSDICDAVCIMYYGRGFLEEA